MVGTIDARHGVEVDESVTPNAIRYSPVFNVAVAFIDRPLAEGHGERIAALAVERTQRRWHPLRPV